MLFAVTVAFGLLLSGCATARNYDDPEGPVYVGGRPAGGNATGTLRVVSFNLKWGREVARAAELFSRPGPLHDADLVVLQEMDLGGTKRLAEAFGFAYVYVPSAVHPVPRQDFGVAILARWPLDAPYKLLLPRRSRFRKLRRSAAVATLRSPLGPIRVYGIHLESPMSGGGGHRRDQASAVAADAKGFPGFVVAAGDFNGRGGPRVLATAGFTWATEDVHDTAGPFDLDHILARGLCPVGSSAAGKAEDETHASDHHPVWALLALCPGPDDRTAKPRP